MGLPVLGSLWFAPGTGYGKAQAMQDFDDQINADG
jgi:hypothetical protein